MMRIIVISVLALIAACSLPEKPPTPFSYVPELSLPLKIRCDSLNMARRLDTTFYFGKITGEKFSLVLTHSVDDHAPVLYSTDSTGLAHDSIVLGRMACYTGTDSYYQPWIEITNDLQVVITDTVFSHILKKVDNPKTKDIVEFTSHNDTAITMDIYRLDRNGKFKEKK